MSFCFFFAFVYHNALTPTILTRRKTRRKHLWVCWWREIWTEMFLTPNLFCFAFFLSKWAYQENAFQGTHYILYERECTFGWGLRRKKRFSFWHCLETEAFFLLKQCSTVWWILGARDCNCFTQFRVVYPINMSGKSFQLQREWKSITLEIYNRQCLMVVYELLGWYLELWF